MTITDFLLVAAAFVLLMVAIGLARVLYGPADVDRILSVQLIGSGGVAVLLLLSVGMNLAPVMDVGFVAHTRGFRQKPGQRTETASPFRVPHRNLSRPPTGARSQGAHQ